MKQISIGVMGCANIAERFVIPCFRDNEKFDLCVVASRTLQKAESFAAKFNCKAVVGYNELLKENIEAVYIPLPTALHFKWGMKALEAGKHVLMEKSIGSSLDEVEKLTRMAREKKLALIEHFQFRFHNQMMKIKSIISSGDIGEVRTIRSSFGFPPFPDHKNIRYSKALGGGALLDAGAYPIRLSQIFLGNNLKVTAAKLSYDLKKNIDLWGNAFLETSDSDVCSEISFGFDNFYQCKVEIWGSKGKLTSNRIFTSPPGERAMLILEQPNNRQEIVLPEDNHFINFHTFFYDVILSCDFEKEYRENLVQAQLIQQLRDIANEKR